MSTKLSSASTVTYPDYTPPVSEVKKQNKFVTAFQNTVDFFGAIASPAIQGMIFMAMAGGAISLIGKLEAVHMPEWVNVMGHLMVGIPAAILVIGLVVVAIATPFVVTALVLENRQYRHNKTMLGDSQYLRVVESLTALGFADADKTVGAGVLNAEAYLRVYGVAANIARKQGMAEAEVNHHSHNIALIMYPDVDALTREIPLTRALNDLGVSNANDALAAASLPQYSVFAVPVTDEEVLASLEPADPKNSGDWELVGRLEAKVAKGHKLTIAERRMLNGTKAAAGAFGDGIGKSLFFFVTAVIAAAVLGAVIGMTLVGVPAYIIVLVGLFGSSLAVAGGLGAVSSF